MGKHKKNLSENEIVLYPLNRDISKRWYMEYYNPLTDKIGRIWINSLKTVDERLNEYERIKSDLLQNGSVQKKNNPDTFQPILAASKRLKNALNEKSYLKKKSKSSYKSKIKLFDEFCIKRGYSAITSTVAHEYLKHRIEKGLAIETVNNDRRILKQFVKSVSNSSTNINKAAFDNTKKLRGGGGAGREYYRPHQKEQIKKYFEKYYPQLWFACKFVYYCYIRNGNELINLKVSDLDLHLNRLKIGADTSKNGLCEVVVIPKVFVDELKLLGLEKYQGDWFLVGKNGIPSEKKLSVDFWGKLHRKALDAMNFDKGGKRYSMYSWKNTGVVDSYLAGIGIKDLQAQLRHKNLETTYLYLRSLGLFDNADTFNKIQAL